jgi:hydroxypyruvate reductase
VLDGAADRAITLIAAGTDGRDGPNDAAGAVVDNRTWSRIIAAGRDPAADLQAHDAYLALDAAGALLRTGPTGTNVMDIVAAILRPAVHA